jgi:hypothetical protein
MTDQPSKFAECETLEQVVFQAIGAGSMCWEHRHGGGIFQDHEATEVGHQAVARIRELAPNAVADELRALRELLAERLTKPDPVYYAVGTRWSGEYRHYPETKPAEPAGGAA